MTPVDATDLQPGQQFGPYTVVRLLGRGGMGAVWLAIQPSLNREVALKVMAAGIQNDPEYVARFRREGLTAARLNHPHIVSVFDIGEAEGALYLCLEYVPGEALNVILKREQAIRPDHAARWAAQIAHALAFAHERGVLHRDVKPSNVLIDPGGHARLMDFGLAKNVDGTALTSTGVLGTPYYMAPELGDGADASALSDQYSLGVMLYELVAGRVPYVSETALGVLYQHMHSTPPPLTEFSRDVPLKLESTIQRMMAREPGERFPTCDEAADALEAIAAGEAQSARTPSYYGGRDEKTVVLGEDSGRAGPPGPQHERADRPTPTHEPAGKIVFLLPARQFMAVVAVGIVVLAGVLFGLVRRSDAPAPPPAVPLQVDQMGTTRDDGPDSVSTISAVALAPPWEEAPFTVLDARGGFTDGFAGARVALRPQLIGGLPRVSKDAGRIQVQGDAATVWRGRSLRAVRLSRAEVMLTVEPTTQSGEAGLFVEPQGDGRGCEVLLDATGRVRVSSSNGTAPADLASAHVAGAEAGQLVRITILAGPRGLRVQVNDTPVHGWDDALGDYGFVGVVARGPVRAAFDRIVVRPAGV